MSVNSSITRRSVSQRYLAQATVAGIDNLHLSLNITDTHLPFSRFNHHAVRQSSDRRCSGVAFRPSVVRYQTISHAAMSTAPDATSGAPVIRYIAVKSSMGTPGCCSFRPWAEYAGLMPANNTWPICGGNRRCDRERDDQRASRDRCGRYRSGASRLRNAQIKLSPRKNI